MSKPRRIADFPNKADDYDEAVSKSHVQNTDTALDQGGDNEVTAEEIREHVDSNENPHQVTAGQVGAYTKGETREFAALPVPALPQLLQVDPEQFNKALVSGYYEEGDTEKAVIWEWDDSRGKDDHDGWSCLNPDHLSDIGTAGWYDPQGDGTDDAGTGVWVRKNIIALTVLDFGARDEEEYDNTLHFQVMADSTGYVAIPDSQYPFEIDRLVTTRTTHIFPSAVRARLKVRPESNNYCISLDHDGSGVSKGIHIDGNFASKTPVRIQANDCFAYFSVENVTADASAAHSAISGLLIQGANNAKFEIYAENFANTGYSNESAPRVVTAQGASGGFYGDIYGKNVQCGLCLGGDVTEGDVGDLHLENAADNGIYQLGSSSILNVNSFIYRGSEEGIVAGGSQTNINSVYISGGSSACVSLMAGDIKVIDFRVDGQVGASPSTVFRARPSYNTGKVEVVSLTGTIWGNSLIDLSLGNSCESFRVLNADITFLYTQDRIGQITRWLDLDNASEIYLQNFKATIVDVNDELPGGSIFEVRVGSGGSSTNKVVLINPEFYIRRANGDKHSAILRILRLNRDNCSFTGVKVFTSLGYIIGREADYLTPFAAGVNQADRPPSGNAAIGTTLIRNDSFGTTPYGWIRSTEGREPLTSD